MPRQICQKYSDWVMPHRAASYSSLAFSSSVSLIFRRTFSSCVLKLIPPFCRISAVGGGIQGSPLGMDFAPGGRNPMLAIPVDRATAGNSVLPPLRIFLPSSTTTFSAQNGTFFLRFSKNFVSLGQIKKPATYTTVPAGRSSPRWCLFWFVYVTGFICINQINLFSWRSLMEVL